MKKKTINVSSKHQVTEFKEKQSKIRTAVEAMISEADDVANGKGSYATYEDVFNLEDTK